MDGQIYCTTEFDEQFLLIPSLKWLPWVGSCYTKSKQKLLIIGESQYEDGDNWQAGMNATRVLIEKNALGIKSKICRNTEKVILFKENPTIEDGNYIWKSVVYINLVQRLMRSIKERPSDIDYDNGWKIFFDIVEIIKPNTCIVLGKSSCGRLGYFLNNNDTGWQKNDFEFMNADKIITITKNSEKLKLIFINHPSGSRGFNYERWAKLLSLSEPELKLALTRL